jgi:predicted aspartyl protease
MTIPPFRRFLPLLGALAMAAGSSPAAADDKPACQYVELAKVPLHYTGPSLEITMEGVINGTPAQMLVDTGSYQTMLTRTGTEKRGLNLRMTGESIQGVGGYSRLYSARVNDFKTGPAKSSKGFIPVIGDTGSAPAFDAIVGASFLLQTDLQLALADKSIKFYKPIGCEKSWLAYWDRNAVEIPFEYHGDRSPNPHFTIEVNGEKLEAIIDSGSWTTSIDSRAARRAGLRLDAPGVVRTADGTGIGERHVAHYNAMVDTLKIGDETIRNAQVSIMDTDGQLNVDVLLGADFLRAHRVLFAMSQKKLYISYLGSAPMGQRRTLEPWIQQEADNGNPDAQMMLASLYGSGSLVPKDPAKSAAWLEKAAGTGHPRANLLVGRQLMGKQRWAEAAQRIAGALAQLPAERYGALWLYDARLRSGDAASARRELEATFARSEDHAWPAPIADFYLGRIDAAALLEQAGKEAKLAKTRTCQANNYMAEWHAAQGDDAKSTSLMATVQAYCASAPPAAKSAGTT